MKTDKLTTLLGLYAGGGLLVAAVLFLFVIKPQYDAASKLHDQTASYNTKITALNVLNQDTNQLRANYAAIKTKRDQILSLLPPQSEEERLLLLISNLATQSGITMSTFAPQPAVVGLNGTIAPPAGTSLYPVTLSVTGSYTDLQTFLNSLEKAGRFVNVDSGTVTTASASSSGVNAQINLTAYYQQSTSSATPTTAAAGGAK